MNNTQWFVKDDAILCKWQNDEHRVNVTIGKNEHLTLHDVAGLMNHAYKIGMLEKQYQIKNALGIE